MDSAKEERGQGLVEYALILVLVVLVIFVLLTVLGPAIGNMYSNVITNLQNLPPTPVP